MVSKRYYISGFIISNARKMTEFIFGDFFIRCDLNQKLGRFEIMVHRELKSTKGEIFKLEDYVEIEHFKKWWGPQWVIMHPEVRKEMDGAEE